MQVYDPFHDCLDLTISIQKSLVHMSVTCNTLAFHMQSVSMLVGDQRPLVDVLEHRG